VASWHNLAVALAVGLLVFRFYELLGRLQQPVQFSDAAGLGVFAVGGIQKALGYGTNWPMAAVLGMISGTGGGQAVHRRCSVPSST
jgi:uncharacterized membrane protein YeiH